MRILWLHQYFSTPNGWGAVRTYEFARRFVAKGYSVDVVCCSGYDEWLESEAEKSCPVLVDGIRAFVCKTKYAPEMSFWQRVFSFLSFMFYAIWFVFRNGGRYDLCIASSGPLTMAIPALAGKLFRRLPYVFEVIDVWPDSAIGAGVLRNRILQNISFYIEKLTYRCSAAIVTCSTGMTDRIINKLLDKSVLTPQHRIEIDNFPVHSLSLGSGICKVQTISNSCDLDQFRADELVRKQVRTENAVGKDVLVVLYSGAMGISNQIDDLINAINATKEMSDIVWWLAGNGVRADELKALQEKARVRFFGQLSKIEVAGLYQGADLNLVTFMHTPLFYENSPNKFFDGIAAGLPTLFNRGTWLEPWLKLYSCGMVCDCSTTGTTIAEELKLLAKDHSRLKNMSAGARQLAEVVFSRDLLADNYVNLLENSI